MIFIKFINSRFLNTNCHHFKWRNIHSKEKRKSKNPSIEVSVPAHWSVFRQTKLLIRFDSIRNPLFNFISISVTSNHVPILMFWNNFQNMKILSYKSKYSRPFKTNVRYQKLPKFTWFFRQIFLMIKLKYISWET